jgi:hypothetical protein
VVHNDEDGTKTLVQLSAPDMDKFYPYFTNTTMNETDIILICINRGYMPAAKDIFKNMNDKGQRLMVSLPQFNPTPDKVTLFREISEEPDRILAKLMDIGDVEEVEESHLTASIFSGVWTGRMADIYAPVENTFTGFGAQMDDLHGTYQTTELTDPSLNRDYMSSLGYGHAFMLPRKIIPEICSPHLA